MINKAIENKVFKYFDKNGISLKNLTQIKVTWNHNIYNETYINNNGEHNLNKPAKNISIDTPFNLKENEINELVINYIYETTGVLLDNIGQILTNPSYNGVPFLLILNEHNTTKKVSLARKSIPGSLIIRPDYYNVGIKSLGKIERINGDLGICDAPIEDLGNLLKIKGDLWITRYDDRLKLKSLKPLIEVGGNLSINDKNITSLDSVEVVKGNLSLRKSSIKNLGNLKFVGGNFIGNREIFENYDFSKIEIKGKVRLYKG